MSDCLHCDIHEMLDVHLQSEQADLGEIAARVTEVLADLILLAPPDEQTMLLAAVVANLGGMVLEKNEEADPDNPRRDLTPFSVSLSKRLPSRGPPQHSD
jgi:hypothetical protein